MTTIINCIQGYSSSSRKNKENIFSAVQKQMKEVGFKTPYIQNHDGNEVGVINNSQDFIINSFKALKGRNFNLFLIGKSMGGVKTFYVYKDLFRQNQNILRRANKIRVLLVDPHGHSIRDINPITYSSLRDMKLPSDWDMGDCKFFNIYQQQHYPKGAYVRGADSNQELKGVDHFEIDTCEAVNERIRAILEEL